MNIFLIASPLQLLNAIEAKHFFKFNNNHLIVVSGVGFPRNTQLFDRLIRDSEWDTIRYLKLYDPYQNLRLPFCNMNLPMSLIKYWSLVPRYLNRRAFDRLAHHFSAVNNIILGNYLEEWHLYMRHFANSLKHDNLYLVDDGTDVIKVSHERKEKAIRAHGSSESVQHPPWLKRIKRLIYRRYCDWDTTEAAKVIFFSVYDIDVRNGDRVIKNNYGNLRQKTSEIGLGEHVLFLGQNLIEDRYIDREVYYRYLQQVQNYFNGKEVVYIPHPRESGDTTNYVKEHLHWKVQRLDVPVECHLVLGKTRPAILASFSCSALVSCAEIVQELSVRSFYIKQEHILRYPEFIEEIYRYFRTNGGERFQVVQFSNEQGIFQT